MQKVLFLGLFHGAYDTRLYYRQVGRLLQHFDDVECIYVGDHSANADIPPGSNRYRVVTLGPARTRLQRLSRYFRLLGVSWAERPAYVQASHVRELISAVSVRVLCGARFIYDSHEDWFSMAYEYSGKTVRGLLQGLKLRVLELLLMRFATHVFCTDHYLLSLYRKRIFGANRVDIVRNFADTSFVRGYAKAPRAGEALKLVYVGGVNRYRGVAECGDYVRRYNKQAGKEMAMFDVYGPCNAMVNDLARRGLINYRGFITPPEVMGVLAEYHVGVCLLQHITKFERNLPIKNFEYMAVGLPVLTSDFGDAARYVKTAEAGFCIDPADYDSFQRHLTMLADREVWTRFSRNGVRATSEHYNVDTEIEPYLAVFGEPTAREGGRLRRG